MKVVSLIWECMNSGLDYWTDEVMPLLHLPAQIMVQNFQRPMQFIIPVPSCLLSRVHTFIE